MHRVARQIYHAIQGAKNILLIPHPHPDGDALGSVAAMMQYARQIEKPHAAFCATSISPKLRFLPHVDYITTNPAVWGEFQPDTVMVFDTGDLRYAQIETYLKQLETRPTIINIDHHVTNEHYGELNLVDPTASATTEVLYRFFRVNNIRVDSTMATALLAGLLTDTDHFTNAATSPRSLTVASELIHRGGDLTLIQAGAFKDKTLNSLKLWGVALSRLARHDRLGLVHTHLTQKDLTEHGVSETEAEGIANFMNNLADGRAALILKELPANKVKGSFRTTRNDVDVSAWAKALGGGGHKKAAGFTLDGTIPEVVEKVFSQIANLEKT